MRLEKQRKPVTSGGSPLSPCAPPYHSVLVPMETHMLGMDNGELHEDFKIEVKEEHVPEFIPGDFSDPNQGASATSKDTDSTRVTEGSSYDPAELIREVPLVPPAGGDHPQPPVPPILVTSGVCLGGCRNHRGGGAHLNPHMKALIEAQKEAFQAQKEAFQAHKKACQAQKEAWELYGQYLAKKMHL